MNLPAALSLLATLAGIGVGILALGIGGSPRWSRYRLLPLTALIASLDSAAEIVTTFALRDDVFMMIQRAEGAASTALAVSLHAYCDGYLRRATPRWEWIARAAALFVGLGWLVPGLYLDGAVARFAVPMLGVVYTYPTLTTLGALVFALAVASVVVPIVRFVGAARLAVEGALVHSLALSCLFATAVHDCVVQLAAARNPFLLSTGLLCSIGGIGVVLVRSLVADVRELDDLMSRLEQLVEERTTELVTTEAALMRAEKLAALGQLSAGVAHEINNPAAAVSGNLEYLREELKSGRVGGDALSCIDDSLEAVDRIAKIVRQLLDLGRAAATTPGQNEVTSVSKAVQQALGSARPSLRPSIRVTTHVVDDLFVRGDEASLVQVLVNLLVNAGQAIPESRDGIIVVRAVEETDDRIVLTVVDNGAGMSDETKRRLFEPFYTTKPFGHGTGLGLSLSLGIVRSLGGEVVVASKPGETVMRVELPVATSPSPTSSGRLRAWDRRRSLLLVEDDERVRRALSRTLASKFQLELVDGVDDALARIEKERFDVVLTDWKMPGGGGRRLYGEAVRRRPEIAPWIIVMTGGGLSGDDRSFLEQNEIQVLDKPLAIESLVDAVRDIEKAVRAKRDGG